LSVVEIVERAVDASFPDDERAAARMLLADVTCNEATRVQLAVLALASGSLEKLRRRSRVRSAR
jgi:hypothetical protein